MEDNLRKLYNDMNSHQKGIFINALMEEFSENKESIINWIDEKLNIAKREMIEKAILIAQNVHNN